MGLVEGVLRLPGQLPSALIVIAAKASSERTVANDSLHRIVKVPSPPFLQPQHFLSTVIMPCLHGDGLTFADLEIDPLNGKLVPHEVRQQKSALASFRPVSTHLVLLNIASWHRWA